MVLRFIRQLVSKKRKRYVKDGFDLDLSYITDKIIAMSYPADQHWEALYRNPMGEVEELLNRRHMGHYKVYNLCAECHYAKSYFGGAVEYLPFDDFHVPPLSLIKLFCESVHKWLQQKEENIVAVHCRAGKGRTGLMLCCYLVFTGLTPDEALQLYSERRTMDMRGVTIASQRRYVYYWGSLVTPGIASPESIVLPPSVPRTLRRVRLYDMLGDRLDFSVSVLDERRGQPSAYAPPVQVFTGQCSVQKRGVVKGGSNLRRLMLTSIPVEKELYLLNAGGDATGNCSPKWVPAMDTEKALVETKPYMDYIFDLPLKVDGNVCITFYEKMGGARCFFVCFNTTFVTNGLLSFRQDELDRLTNRPRKLMGGEFSLELLFGVVQPLALTSAMD